MGSTEFGSLFRRHRPSQFSELVGQQDNATALAKAARAEAPQQAWIFEGLRGSGKTSAARIFAKALNCEDLSPEGEPCDKCDSCLEITTGHASMSVIELDAASKNGTADVENLLKNVSLASSGKKKVYILDEAHAFSTQAQNRLLKSLEEPPPHVVWILATTEPHKLLSTVRSRCLELRFNPVTPKDLTEHLTKVAETESLDVSAEQISLAVKQSQGSVRDALTALETLELSGETGAAAGPDDLVNAILASDRSELLEAIAKAVAEGADVNRLAENAVAVLRDLFLITQGASELVTVVTPDDTRAAAGPKVIVASLEAIGEALTSAQRSADPRIALEVQLLRVIRKAELAASAAA